MWKLEVMALSVPLYRDVVGETEENYENPEIGFRPEIFIATRRWCLYEASLWQRHNFRRQVLCESSNISDMVSLACIAENRI
jgi:hypothetical protein